MRKGLLGLVLWVVLASAAMAGDRLRVAVYNVELDRNGPGLLLRDILKGTDDVRAVAQVIRQAAPDILLMTRFDYDYDLAALGAFNDELGEARFPYWFALRPNTGRVTGVDVNQNGRLGEPEDAQSHARFAGQNGMAILSRHPVLDDDVRDFSGLLWRDLPGPRLPERYGAPFWGTDVLDVLRLSTTGHWDVPVQVGDHRLNLWAFHASPPIFDGPEDRNGLRAGDEVRLWQAYMDGVLGAAPPERFVVIGTSNIDPQAGEGRRADMAALLADGRVQDPPRLRGRPTVDFGDAVMPPELRVDYVLPAAGLTIVDAGVVTDPAASRHHLVWVDLRLP